MSLATGDLLGDYEIVALLGRGGMGEVWRAHDPKLNRDVAIKISAQQFNDRFEREARAIAALNHPNICTLYHIGPNYLVMELIEGPTLADRIAEGPIPLEEALGIAKQIAAALEAAHDKAIVHRDLKPANVKIRPDGSVKVLDFGLAKTAEEVLPSSDSPTMLSVAGMILGTAGYMAPEQARAKKEVDKRADIWAFGVVLYEMLTGKRLFEGEDVGQTLASVIMQEPDLSLAPAEVRPLLKRCLEKDPNKRLRDITGLEFLLNVGQAVPPAHRAEQANGLLHIGWIAAVTAPTLLLAALAFVHFREKPPVTHVSRFQYTLPEGQNFTRTGRHDIAISPDGTKLAYVANNQLYLRAMDQLDAQPVRGTNEDPMEPVFSPDGQWLAYFVPASGGTNASPSASAWVLKKIAFAGGAPVTLVKLPNAPFGATWRNETIAFGINEGSTAAIQAAPESGGTLRTLLTGDRKNEQVTQPQLLADGKHVLFVSLPAGADEGQVVVQTLNGNDRKTLVNGGTDPRVLPSGQLVYIHDGTLFGVPFDVKNLTVTGGPVPLVEGVAETSTSSVGQFAVSSDGTLAFRPGAVGGIQHVLTWVDREGHEEAIPAKPKAYLYPRLSPDGTKIAVNSFDEEHDIWVFDLAKATLTRLTFGPAFDYHPIWTPDNTHLLFSSGPAAPISPADIFRKAADGTGSAEALTQHFEGGNPISLTPDGKSLVFRRFSPTVGLFVLPLEPKAEARPLLADPKFIENNGEISPDGRWIAYDSNESGRYEIYVRPFPAVDTGRWQISSEGGATPVWARSGRELFFATVNKMFVVPVPAGTSFTYGKPQPLFDTTPYYRTLVSRPFDISADGKRFLMLRDAPNGNTGARPSIVVVSHWFDQVKSRLH